MRAVRIPIIVLVVGLLVVGVLAPRWRLDGQGGGAVSQEAQLDRWLPTTSGADAGSSVWYCVAGTARGEGGLAEQTVVIANVTDRAARVDLTAVPSEGDSVRRSFEVPARSRVDTVLSDLVTAPFAAALVEVTGGTVAVSHVLKGRVGWSQGPCASSPATHWYFPAGTTRERSREILAVFNPFPDAAVLDITNPTDEGVRTAGELQAKVVPAGKLAILEVNDVVTVRASVTSAVNVRSGRVVVERIQIYDPDAAAEVRSESTPGTGPAGSTTSTTESSGTTGSTTPGSAAPLAGRGLSVDLGSPVVSPTWVFPSSPARAEDTRTEYVLYNPGKDDADAVIGVTLADEPGSDRPPPAVEPFTVTVRGEQFVTVSLDNDERVPVDRPHWDFVFTSNGVPIVAERMVRRLPEAIVPGLDLTIGAPIASDRWVVPTATWAGARSSVVTVVNPGPGPVRFAVRAVRDGEDRPIDGAQDVLLPPGRSRSFDLGLLGSTSPVAALVQADGPVVVGHDLTFDDPLAVASSLGIPVASGLTRLAAPDLTADVLTGAGQDVVDVPGSTPFTVERGPDSIPGTSTTTSAAPTGSGAPTGTDPTASVETAPSSDPAPSTAGAGSSSG